MMRTKESLTFNNTNYHYSDSQQPENGYIDKQSDSKSHNLPA
jgi:hypothetical protein